MKNLTIILLACLTLAACKKDDPFAENDHQIVNYKVECATCLVYFNDTHYPEQKMVASGIWEYTWANTNAIDTAYVRVFTSVFTKPQNVSVQIKTADGLESSWQGQPEPGMTKTVILPLYR